MSEKNHKEYLGDGVYADWDGYHVVLTTASETNNVIYLEDAVIQALNKYVERLSTPANPAPTEIGQ